MSISLANCVGSTGAVQTPDATKVGEQRTAAEAVQLGAVSPNMLEVAFIRHGQTFGNAKIEPPEGTARGDDMLTPLGMDQATLLGQDPAFVATASTADAVLVSPLRRALQTAVLALSTDQVANARQQLGLDGPIVLLLDADLRELNRRQRRGDTQGLSWRHRGTV